MTLKQKRGTYFERPPNRILFIYLFVFIFCSWIFEGPQVFRALTSMMWKTVRNSPEDECDGPPVPRRPVTRQHLVEASPSWKKRPPYRPNKGMQAVKNAFTKNSAKKPQQQNWTLLHTTQIRWKHARTHTQFCFGKTCLQLRLWKKNRWVCALFSHYLIDTLACLFLGRARRSLYGVMESHLCRHCHAGPTPPAQHYIVTWRYHVIRWR